MCTSPPTTTPGSPEDSPLLSSLTPEMPEMLWRLLMALSWMDVPLPLSTRRKTARSPSRCVVITRLPVAEETEAEGTAETEAGAAETTLATEEVDFVGGETTTRAVTTTQEMVAEVVAEDAAAVAVATEEPVAGPTEAAETETGAAETRETTTGTEERS